MGHPQQHTLWDSMVRRPSAALARQFWQTLHTAIAIRMKLHSAMLKWSHTGNSHFTKVIPLLTLYMQAISRHRKIPFRGNRLYSAAFSLLQSVTTQWWHKSRFPGTLKPRKKVHGVQLAMAAEICLNREDQMYTLCVCVRVASFMISPKGKSLLELTV